MLLLQHLAAYRVSVHTGWSPEDISNMTVILRGLSTNHTACLQASSCNSLYTCKALQGRRLHKLPAPAHTLRGRVCKVTSLWTCSPPPRFGRRINSIHTPGVDYWCNVMRFFSVIALIFHTAPLADTCHKLRFNGAVPLRWDEWCSTLTRAGLNGELLLVERVDSLSLTNESKTLCSPAWNGLTFPQKGKKLHECHKGCLYPAVLFCIFHFSS